MTFRLETRGAIAQENIRCPLTTENWVRCQASSCEICGGRSDTKTGFLKKKSTFSLPNQFTNTPYSSSSSCHSCEKDKRAKVVTSQIKKFCYGNG